MKRILLSLPFAFVGLGSLVGRAEQPPSILTDHTVELRETVSSQGFVHPGISCTAETLGVMREKVLAGVSPWVDYFEGLRRTRFADLRERPRFVRRITNDEGIAAFAHDAHLAWAHTILYVVTGNEEYRKTPVEILRWYGSRTDASFFPHPFPDSHIKIGKYVYTLCTAVDILRSTTPHDQRLAVTPSMIDALRRYCLYPIRQNSIEKNGYFMNQHSYAIMGYLACTILGDEVEGYQQAVEWTTVNASAPNQGRNGSIKQQIRLVTRNDRTGEPVTPRLQVVEMGRDQPHAGGNIDNLLMMAKTIAFQRTKVDPVRGTVTHAADGVLPVHFLDDRLPKGAALFARYNVGYGLEPWVPTFSETAPDNTVTYNQVSYHGRGSITGNGIPAGYYFYKAIGFDLENGPYRSIKIALDATAEDRDYAVKSGNYLDRIHNYAFDFWIGLPASASDAAPDPAKARRALAPHLPSLTRLTAAAPGERQQVESHFVDLSAHARPGDIYPGSKEDKPLDVRRDTDGTGYVRMTLEQAPRTVVVTARFQPGTSLRVRSRGFVRLNIYRDEDFARRGCVQELYVPSTDGEWTRLLTQFECSGLTYIEATPLDGPAMIDFDRVDANPSGGRSVAFESDEDSQSLPAVLDTRLEQVFGATGDFGPVSYRATPLPAGAEFNRSTGRLSWTPSSDQKGDHTFFVTARTGDTQVTRRVKVHVAADLNSALEYVARAYDPSQRYVSATEKAFKTARVSRDLWALKRAADRLELLTPRLPDGSLDYVKAWSYSEFGSHNMADNDPLTFGNGNGPDKSITMNFGRHFKVRSDAFRLQARDGFPIRVAKAVVYGSNDGVTWRLLTKHAAANTADMQTLEVKPEERSKAYRYVRFTMPAEGYPLFELAELRIVGERVEAFCRPGCGHTQNFQADEPTTQADSPEG
jgi:hypothetical protein